MTIDLNCDMGEGMPTDAAIMPYISSANIACGYHAGNEDTMRKTIDLCIEHEVAIGAHPGFDDKPNFGRAPIQLSSDELSRLVWKQLEIIQRICKEKNAMLHHVKPHGAMYNMAAKDRQMSEVIARVVKNFNPSLVYYGLSGSVMTEEAEAIGLKTANEVFGDRTYQDDGSLTSRFEKNALIANEEAILHQVIQMITDKTVKAISGKIISVKVDTICLHGDGQHALESAKLIHQHLRKNDISIAAVI